MKPGHALLLLLLVAGSLALRLPQLDRRPMHNDEAVNGVKFLGLWERGEYRYDPQEFHGPLLHYLTLPWAWAAGAQEPEALSERTLRLTLVLFGTLLVLVPWLTWRTTGWGAALAAGLFTAVSPAMVFYSRYFIHEVLLVFFSFLFLAACWRHAQSGRTAWLGLAGAALGLMHASKETFVFVPVAAGGAWAAGWALDRWCGGGRWPLRLRLAPVLLGLGIAGLVSAVLFTSFFTNARGPWDSLLTYGPWIRRAEGASPHVHAWYYYLELLGFARRGPGPVWTEGIILALAGVAMVAGIRARSMPTDRVVWVRFLTFYTLILMGIYSVIPYKTPWCALGFLHGAILLAGVGVHWLWDRIRGVAPRAVFLAALGLGVAHLGLQGCRAAFTYCDSQRNPHVYAHSLASVVELAGKVKAIAAASPDGRRSVIQVVARGGDYWPLPWYLRGFERTGWYAEVPESVAAPIVIASPEFAEALARRTHPRHEALGYFGLRPAVFLQLHVEAGLWARYLQAQGAK